MFLCVLKVLVLIVFVYGVYSGIMLVFDLIDAKKYKRCVYIDSMKVTDVEDALYTAFMRYPDTEIFIVYSDDTDSETKKIISRLCKTYDIVYSVEGDGIPKI